MKVDETKAERVKAFKEWFASQHAKELEDCASWLMLGYCVRMSYDPDKQRIAFNVVLPP